VSALGLLAVSPEDSEDASSSRSSAVGACADSDEEPGVPEPRERSIAGHRSRSNSRVPAKSLRRL